MYNWKLPDVNSSLNGCKTLTEKLTCCVFFKWKHDPFNTTLKVFFSELQFWGAKKPLNQNLTRFEKIRFKIMLLKKHQKCKISRFLGVKWTKTWFLHAKIFQNLICSKFFNSKSNAFSFFQSKIWRFLKFLIKIWRVRKFEFKIWEVSKFLSPKCEFYLVFQVLTEWRYFLSTSITPYFEDEKWTTMFVVVLVTRSRTGSCQTSNRLSMVVKLLNEKLTCCVFFKWKHDPFNTTLKVFFSELQIWRAKKPLNRNLTRFEKIHFKIMLLKKHQKCKISGFLGVKWTKKWFFACKNFSKPDMSKFFQFKI